MRQQTLRATLTWSYNLLDPAAQRLFRRLAVLPTTATYQRSKQYVESLELSQQLNDQRMTAGAYRALGLVAAHQCDYERAVPLYNQSLATSWAIDDRHGIAITLSNLGDVLRCRQQYTHAA
jgi:hypothetical protein